MQNLKIYKKSPVMINSVLFAMFSIAFIHVIKSFVAGVSAFDFKTPFKFVNENSLLLISLLVFWNALFKGKKYSKLIYLVFIFQCIYILFLQYLIVLDKFVLILNFLFLILSFYFYLFMNADLEEASNTPIVNQNDLYSSSAISGEVLIELKNFSLKGNFINWDEGTCFLKIEENIKKAQGPIVLKWKFEEIEYECKGVIVSAAKDLGLGVRMTSSVEISSKFGWQEFYDIINTRGYSPYLTA